MMSIELYLTFLAAVVLLALTPGPLMALLISTSVSFGTAAGVRILAGSVLGLTVLVCCIVLGLTSIVQFMSDWFNWVKLAGAAYLIWLGFVKLRDAGQQNNAVLPVEKHHRFLVQGFMVSIANPKILLFLAAFLPQFLNPAHDMQFQLIIYGVSFVVTIAVVDLMYVLAIGKTKSLLSRTRLALFDRVGGVLLMCGGVWLMLSRRN